MNQSSLIPVILSGGTGSRLWPVSRELHPKPFIRLTDGQSLLQKTLLRALSFKDAAEIITITNSEYYLKTKAEYEKVTTRQNISFLLEPCARNTAPALAVAALKVFEDHGPDAVLLVLPADHLIENINSFTEHCQKAFALANTNKIVTFGIAPLYPETGFGYIEYETLTHNVKRFVEKPSATLAQTYLESGCYLWNSGMFCFKASILLNEFEHHAPNLLRAAKKCWHLSAKKSDTLLDKSFANLESVSIDYAIMEKSKDIAVVMCDFNWQDIGSWEAYKKLHTADNKGNTILGDAILIDSENNFIHSENRMIASIGIQNLAIVDTPDALLITDRTRTQDVKHIVHALKEKKHESYLEHKTVLRPWGSYTVLEVGPSFKIKRIMVKPGASLSLQLHKQRSEHWVVVEGTAKVINGDKTYLLQKNESTFVPINTAHRLSNPGQTDLIIIEVQTGSYVGEDDIVRLEDVYGRIT